MRNIFHDSILEYESIGSVNQLFSHKLERTFIGFVEMTALCSQRAEAAAEQASDRGVALEDRLANQRGRGSEAVHILRDAHTRWVFLKES